MRARREAARAGRRRGAASATSASAAAAAQRGLGAFAPEFRSLEAAGRARSTAFLVDVAAVRDAPSNPRARFDEEELEALARSIRSEGLLHPITVRPVPAGGARGGGARFEVVTGHRRLRACRRLGFEKVPAFVWGDASEADARVARAVENVQRAQLTPLEEAAAYHAALEPGGLGYSELAERAGVSVDRVRSRLRLLALPRDLAERVGEPGFGLEHAEALLPLAREAPHLLEAVRPLVGKPDYSGRPLTAARFAEEVRRALVDSGLAGDPANWRVTDALGGNAAAMERLLALPRVRVAGEDLVVDAAAFHRVLKEARKDAAAARRRAPPADARGDAPAFGDLDGRGARAEPADAAEAEDADAVFVEVDGEGAPGVVGWEPRFRVESVERAEAARRLEAGFGRAVRGVLGFGPRERALVVGALLEALAARGRADERGFARALAEDAGLGGTEVLDALGAGAGRERELLARRVAIAPGDAAFARAACAFAFRVLAEASVGRTLDAAAPYAGAWVLSGAERGGSAAGALGAGEGDGVSPASGAGGASG